MLTEEKKLYELKDAYQQILSEGILKKNDEIKTQMEKMVEQKANVNVVSENSFTNVSKNNYVAYDLKGVLLLDKNDKTYLVESKSGDITFDDINIKYINNKMIVLKVK